MKNSTRLCSRLCEQEDGTMTSIGIRVAPERLRYLSGRLNAGAGEIDGTLRQLAGSVEPLGSDWAGVAQARFLELWGEWQRSAAGLHQALTGIAHLTAQAATRYEATEQDIAAAFGHS
jgi:WXG100 family type VII secretion target